MAQSLVTNIEVKNANAKQKINELEAEAKALKEELKEVGKTAKQTAKDSARYWKDWGDNLRAADTTVGKFQRRFSDLGNGAVGKFAEGMGMNVASLTKFASVGGAAVAVGAAFAKVSSEAVEQSAAFGKEMSSLSAITGVSGRGLQQMREQIQALGNETSTEVTSIAKNFAQIGSALPQLLKDTAGLGKVSKAAITLGKAGLMELESATDSLTSSMAQFNISADDANKVVDILANAAQLGSAGIQEVAASLQRCGTAANMAGVNISQTSALVEVLASKGLKGAEAGTALRNVFTKMTTSGIDQMNPKVVGLSAALEFLRSKANDAQWMVKTFGAENMTAAAILANNIPMYNELAEGMERSGTAAEMARQNFNNLAGDWEQMGVAWTNLMSSFNVDGANNPLRGIVQGITEIIAAVSELFSSCSEDNEFSQFLDNIPLDPFKELLGIISDLIRFFADFLSATSEADHAVNSLAVAWKALGAVIKVFRDLLWWIENSITYVTLKFREFCDAVDNATSDFPLFKAMGKWIDSLIKGIKQLIDWYRKLKAEFSSAVQEEKDKRKKKGGEESKGSSSSSSSSTTATPTASTTTSTSKTKDPIAEAEKKYAKDIIQIANERKAQFITEKQAMDAEVSAISSLLKTYYSKESLSEDEAKRVVELNKALAAAKAAAEKMADQEIFANAVKQNSTAVSQSKRQYADNYITKDEMDKIVSDARSKLIASLYELKSPTEEQTKLLKDLIKEQNKEKTDKAVKAIREVREELEGEIVGIMKEQPTANELYSLVKQNNSKIVLPQGNGDKSNFGMTNKSYARVESENKTWSPKLSGADKWIDELNKSLDKYAAIEESINKANAETYKQGKAANLSDEEIQVNIITHSEELDALEKDIQKFKQKADEELKFEATISGVSEAVDSLSTLGNSIKTLTKGYEGCEDGLDYFLTTLSMASAVIQGINAVMQISQMVTSLFGASQGAAAAGTTAATTAEQAKAVVDAESVATSTAAAVAVKAQEAAYLDLAAAMIFAAHASIPFAGVALATGFVAEMMAAMAAQQAASLALTAFANGGIVKGSSLSGDNQLIRVNSGEMILNTQQQSNLFDLLDGGGIGGGGATISNVRIKGSDIYLALSNYSKIQAKSGHPIHF